MTAREIYMAGLNAGLPQPDVDAVNKALALMDDAVKQANKIADENSTAWAKLKATVTDVNLDAIKGEAKMLANSVKSMHGTADKLLNDPTTTHDRVISFVKSAADIADLSVLKDVGTRNDLLALVKEVSKNTAADLKVETKGLFESIWGSLSGWQKVAVVAIPVGYVAWKVTRD